MNSITHIALATAVALATAMPASAGQGADFLKGLDGSWRGRGSALIPGRDEPERITCQIAGTFAGDALSVTGECASTQGKTRVSGRLVSDRNKVSGSLINALAGAEMTRSSGSVEGGRLVVASDFVQAATGRLTRTQQIVRRSGGGFTAQFYTYDNASGRYEPAGDIQFSAK